MKILIRALEALALGALIGSIAGIVRAIETISTNDYFHFDLDHLAAKVLSGEISRSVVFGIEFAAAIVAIILIAYPVFRWLRKKPEQAWADALTVPVVLGLLAIGYYVNRQHLPGLFTPKSIIANAAMGAVALGIWFAAAKAFKAWTRSARPAKLLHKAGVFAVPVVLAAVVLAHSTKWIFAPSPPLERPPNVLVLMLDTVRADHMSVYGYSRETTPNLENLAADGILFTQAIAHAGWTKPSVASLFTGMYPRQHGIASSDWGRPDSSGQTSIDVLSPKVLTVAELLANAGYRTVAIGNNHHVIPQTGFDQGFETFQMEIDPDEYWTRAPEVNRRYFRWMDRHQNDAFFVYLHHIDAHWPYRAPPPYNGMYADESPPAIDYNRNGFVADYNEAPTEEIDPASLEHMKAAYDEGVRFVDDRVGDVIDDLKERGIYDETMIVVLADHGEEFLEHGKLAHGETLFEEMIHVPLIIKFPHPEAEQQQQVFNDQVELIDVMPTILSQTGISPPVGLFGRDVLGSRPDPEPAAFSEHDNKVALRTPQHKYIYDFDTGSEELYELTTDPGEQTNLATQQPALAEELRGRIFTWIEVVDTGLSVRSEQIELDEESRKKLEALGYVE